VSELSRGDGCLTGGKRACDLTVNHEKALLTHRRGRMMRRGWAEGCSPTDTVNEPDLSTGSEQSL